MFKVLVVLILSVFNLLASDTLAKYTNECDAGKGTSCIVLGIKYFSGDGVEIDLKKSQTLFRKACKARIAKGCYYLGFIYKRGGNGVKKDELKAKLSFGRACNIGSERSCVEWHKLEAKGI